MFRTVPLSIIRSFFTVHTAMVYVIQVCWQLANRIRIWNLELGHLERSELAQHSFEVNHRVLWEEAKILEPEQNPMYRKYQEEAYMACLQNPISRHRVVFSPIWLPLIRDELSEWYVLIPWRLAASPQLVFVAFGSPVRVLLWFCVVHLWFVSFCL